LDLGVLEKAKWPQSSGEEVGVYSRPSSEEGEEEAKAESQQSSEEEAGGVG
jgi:hypothetical protein